MIKITFSAGSFLTRPGYTLEPRGSPIVTTASAPASTVTGYSSDDIPFHLMLPIAE